MCGDLQSIKSSTDVQVAQTKLCPNPNGGGGSWMPIVTTQLNDAVDVVAKNLFLSQLQHGVGEYKAQQYKLIIRTKELFVKLGFGYNRIIR